MQAKICGLTTDNQVKVAVEYRADFCGFILNYPKSHRHIEYKIAKKLTKIKKENTKFVGVFVNPSLEEISRYSELNFDYFQIYGDYTKDEIIEIKSRSKKKIIIALQIEKELDIQKYKLYEKVADIVLFDSTGLHKSISWNYDWLNNVSSTIIKMVAGNISIDKLESLKKIADIVDVSGALETNKVKDTLKIKKFLKKIEKINGNY